MLVDEGRASLRQIGTISDARVATFSYLSLAELGYTHVRASLFPGHVPDARLTGDCQYGEITMTIDAEPTLSALPAPRVPSRFGPMRLWIGGALCVAGGGALSAALMSLPSREATPLEPAPRMAASLDHGTRMSSSPRSHALQGQDDPGAQACASCGVVESVTAHRQEGKGTGLGAVAGGVLGGVVGHQVGGGNGKKAMTVLGAVGGGFAGNEVEKRARSVTVHRVKVRMEDGTVRTVTQNAAPRIGAKVRVENNRLVAADAA